MRDNGYKQCDHCWAEMEGKAGDYCSEECRKAHERELGIDYGEDDYDEGDPSKDERK